MKVEITSVLKSLALGVLAGAMLKFFVLDIVHIRGSSMEPTFRDGDAVLINKLSYGLVAPFGSRTLCRWRKPADGDVIVYLHEGRLVIKRCVATAPAPLDYSYDTGYTLSVNGHIFPLSETQYQNMSSAGRVPDGMVLAVGDNPAASIDSRDYGFIPVCNVLARAAAPRRDAKKASR